MNEENTLKVSEFLQDLLNSPLWLSEIILPARSVSVNL